MEIWLGVQCLLEGTVGNPSFSYINFTWEITKTKKVVKTPKTSLKSDLIGAILTSHPATNFCPVIPQKNSFRH